MGIYANFGIRWQLMTAIIEFLPISNLRWVQLAYLKRRPHLRFQIFKLIAPRCGSETCNSLLATRFSQLASQIPSAYWQIMKFVGV